ncbi:domain of Kin17 curved DNA-binding protein-domain-containing protein [Massariosphaeria phaeospora]|uniref:Domain of Kin17 curved DNA-binding protein-domain-containing protein n=1 Tax=Massariosphaeria phaeospora TaxID=100035 RepID=A0A7C8I596_9PLEO|nr:domain of Kin17 curved DNA-binding protein-domain-containing protein [Massariosphaeria phaeospora]
MPRAEIGSTKHVANQMKSKGLQRLRWWCEACEKQCRDANGFKCHVQSETHVRKLQSIGENSRGYIEGKTAEFQRDFVSLLRTVHNEKFVNANKAYGEYIKHKEHTHMNATRFHSLTEFVKHLGREGIVNVKEDDKDGLMIAWRDVSVAAVERREAIRAQEMAEARSGAGEDKLLKKMAQRAKSEAEARKAAQGQQPEKIPELAPPAGDMPVKLSFGLKPKTPLPNGLGQMKSKSIFKRARTDGDESERPRKKNITNPA